MEFVDYYKNYHEFWQEKYNFFLKEALPVIYQTITHHHHQKKKCFCTLEYVKTL